MRGKDASLLGASYATGITPAYAGKRPYGLSRPVPPRDHPRVCGEKLGMRFSGSPLLGSPPRMRGKGPVPGQLHRRAGITPAYAGKSPRCCPGDRPPWDHPRVCGEKLFPPLKSVFLQGSPPRMRGKAALFWPAPPGSGITPAYAGKRVLFFIFLFLSWDHPRVCGEKLSEAMKIRDALGSPPRMRGKGSKSIEI